MIDRSKYDAGLLARLHGIPVVRSSHVKDLTLLVPMDFEFSRFDHLSCAKNNGKSKIAPTIEPSIKPKKYSQWCALLSGAVSNSQLII